MSEARLRAESNGFTLLEVMCAFAILAMVTGILTVQYFQAVDRGTRALHLRELREAADTVFRKIIYEEQNQNDGDSKTLDVSYAEWAGMKSGAMRDRWRAYRYELRKERMTAAGSPDSSTGEESIFGSRTTESGRETSRRDEATSGETDVPGLALWRMTVRFFHTDEGSDEPLLVLRTYIPVREEAKTPGPRTPTANVRTGSRSSRSRWPSRSSRSSSRSSTR
jgi:prepilin-type N-terminal cleavage/methylation domain-containing protein